MTPSITARAIAALAGAVAFAVAGFLVGHSSTPAAATSKDHETVAVCVQALDYAREAFGYTADATDAARRAVDATHNANSAAYGQATADLSAANDHIDALSADAQRTAKACRAGAR